MKVKSSPTKVANPLEKFLADARFTSLGRGRWECAGGAVSLTYMTGRASVRRVAPDGTVECHFGSPNDMASKALSWADRYAVSE